MRSWQSGRAFAELADIWEVRLDRGFVLDVANMDGGLLYDVLYEQRGQWHDRGSGWDNIMIHGLKHGNITQ
jgi:hypothetical protein